MATKYTVTQGADLLHSGRGKNAAFIAAGERADATKTTAPVGATITVAQDGQPILIYTMTECVGVYSRVTIRDWDVRPAVRA